MNTSSYQIAQAVYRGEIKRLYLAGHTKAGHAIALEFVDAPPVRYSGDIVHARRLVERFNRRHGCL